MEGSLRAFLDLRDSLRVSPRGHGGAEVAVALTEGLDRAIAGLIDVPDGAAIVAVGGYGRGELSLFSDVDLMVLHELEDPTELAASVFRPMWDAKLRLGHSVRTVKESVTAAKDHVDNHTTLLTARLVTGDSELFSHLMSGIAKVTKARPLRRYLVAAEVERRRRSPYLRMATDVKVGRGGLRTLHGFEWERKREELIGRFTSDSRMEEEMAKESLLRVRNALHAATGREHDVFSPDLREQVASWLGVDVMEAATWLVEAMQTVDDLATRRWPEVVRPRPRHRRPYFWETDRLDTILPEWETVRNLPQLAPFHEHPVASHLLRTVDEMADLAGDDGHYGSVVREVDDTDLLALTAFLHDIGKGHGGDHAEVGASIAGALCERLGMSGDDTSLVEGAVRHHLLLARTATRRDLDDPAVITEVVDEVGDLRTLQVLYLLTVADSRATGPSMWNTWKETLVRTLFTRCAARFGAEQGVDQAASTTEAAANLVGTDRSEELMAHLSGMPHGYLRSVTAEHIRWHLDVIAGLTGHTAVGVLPGDPFQTAVVVGKTLPGMRHQVAGCMAANGIDILEARLLTRSDGMVVDSFRVRDDRTGTSVDPLRWDVFRQDLESAVGGSHDVESKLAARAAAYLPRGEAAPDVRVGKTDNQGGFVVTIGCPDRVGRLAEIIAVLDECGLEIALAKIESREGGVVDTFHVSGDVDDLGVLERRIATALRP